MRPQASAENIRTQERAASVILFSLFLLPRQLANMFYTCCQLRFFFFTCRRSNMKLSSSTYHSTRACIKERVASPQHSAIPRGSSRVRRHHARYPSHTELCHELCGSPTGPDCHCLLLIKLGQHVPLAHIFGVGVLGSCRWLVLKQSHAVVVDSLRR